MRRVAEDADLRARTSSGLVGCQGPHPCDGKVVLGLANVGRTRTHCQKADQKEYH